MPVLRSTVRRRSRELYGKSLRRRKRRAARAMCGLEKRRIDDRAVARVQHVAQMNDARHTDRPVQLGERPARH